MGLFDTFKGNQYKKEVEMLQAKIQELTSTFTPEMRQAENIQNLINNLQNEVNNLNNVIAQKNSEIANLNNVVFGLNNEIQDKKSQIINLDEESIMQDFGLYQPIYDFANSEMYKERLTSIRQEQKDIIKNNCAVTGNKNWTVNGSKAQGNKMVKDMQKLLLRAFNSECDELINKVKYNTLEYRMKKQEEKEEQKEIRARLREEAKLQKEIEEARKKVLKEKSHYANALEKLETQIAKADGNEKAELLNKKAEIESQLSEIQKSIENIDYREANARAGYVYVISNIGAFGENVYKIGMTRRLMPQYHSSLMFMQ